MENSPPGIHTIPLGAGRGGGAVFGTFGRKLLPVLIVEASAALVVGVGEPARATSSGLREQDEQTMRGVTATTSTA